MSKILISSFALLIFSAPVISLHAITVEGSNIYDAKKVKKEVSKKPVKKEENEGFYVMDPGTYYY